MSRIRRAFIIITLLFYQVNCSSKLNLPRILLPILNGVSTNFTLEVSQSTGCYKWSTSRSDLIKVETEGLYKYGCSVNATISVLTTEPTRNMAIVLAEDVETKEVIRADVIVDVISSLNIVTTTRELYMEEPPELFEVRAYDDQGNEFTTLKGVEFQWLIRGSTWEHNPVLRFMTFQESPYEIPSSIVKFENDGKQGHIVLIEGVRTGSAKVSVHLKCPEYNYITPVEVSLLVIANIILDPSEAYILKGDKINFKLLQVRQGRLVDIDPAIASQYSLQSETADIAVTEQFAVIGQGIGKTKITLQDASTLDEPIKLPSAVVTVTEPHYLILSVIPNNNWILITQSSATIVTEVFTRDNHKIKLGQHVTIKTTFPESLFTAIYSSLNGSVTYGYANQPGFGEVISTLTGISSMATKITYSKQLTAQATIYVYPEIELMPSVLYLPWHSTYSLRYQFLYNATGGDGNYLWKTDNSLVATISQRGLLQTTGSGETIVSVSMKQDQTKSAVSKLYVIEPSSMELIPDIHEAAVGDPIFLNIALYGRQLINGQEEKVIFSACEHLVFRVTVSEPFYYNDSLSKEPFGTACRVLAVIGKLPSVQKVTISYQLKHSILEASTMISCFEPLVTFHPDSNKAIILAVGSSSPVGFRYGPNPSFGKIISSLDYDGGLVESSKISERNQLHIFTVMCMNFGETDFTLTLKSQPLMAQSRSLEVKAYVKIICTHPRHLALEALLPESCLLTNANYGFSHILSKTEVKIILKDGQGRDFDNATSLLFEWSVDKNELAYIEKKNIIQLHEVETPDFYYPSYHYKPINIRDKAGQVEITGKIVGFQKHVIDLLNSKGFLKHEKELISRPSLKGTILMKIVDKVQTEPKSISIFNHPQVKSIVTLSNGSDHFELYMIPKDIATFTKDSHKIELVPKNEGHGSLIIKDLCVTEPTITVDVKVFKLAKLKINVVEKVESGVSFTAIVSLYDKEDRLLNFPKMNTKDLQTSLIVGNGDIIKLEMTNNGVIDPMKGVIKYKLKSLGIGETTLTAKCLDVTSEIYIVQVFQPVTISPHSLTLAVGSEIQISVSGGPSPSHGIQYSVVDGYIISVSSIGVVKGLRIGRTQVKAMALGVLGQIFSSDSIEVNVIPLTGVRIVAPTNKILVNNVMPIWVTGIPSELNTFVVGSINPPLNFKWRVSLPSVAQIKDVFQDSNIEVQNEHRLSMRLKALKPGFTHVHVSVSGQNPEGGSYFTYNSTFEMQVFKNLYWSQPQNLDSSTIIVAPQSYFNIKTNRDVEGNVDYQVINIGTENTTTLGGVNNILKTNIVLLEPNGKLHAKSKTGRAIIIARYHDEHATKQSVIMNVEIKHVHYLMLNIVTRMDSSKGVVHSLPQGLHLKLNVSYHDRFGSVFYSAPVQTEIKLNIFDKTNVSPQGSDVVTVSLEKEGNATLKIYDAHGHMEDYLKLPVKNHIYPYKTFIALSDIVCFTLRGDLKGHWKSDSDVLSIDEFGMARALKTGSAVVTFVSNNPDAYISSYLPIEIHQIEMMQISQTANILITNSHIGEKYVIPILFVNEKHVPPFHFHPTKCDKSSLPPMLIPFMCEVRFNTIQSTIPIEHIFTIESSFNYDIGSFACEFTVQNGPSFNTSILSANITLRVNHESPIVPSDSAILNFVPGIYLSQTKLTFLKKNLISFLYISGTPHILNQLIVEVSDSLLFIVSEPAFQNNKCRYTITLDKGRLRWFQSLNQQVDHMLTLISPLTNQKFKIPIVIEDGDEIAATNKKIEDPFSGAFQETPSIMDIFQIGSSLSMMLIILVIPLYIVVYCYNKPSLPGSPTQPPGYTPTQLRIAKGPESVYSVIRDALGEPSWNSSAKTNYSVASSNASSVSPANPQLLDPFGSRLFRRQPATFSRPNYNRTGVIDESVCSEPTGLFRSDTNNLGRFHNDY